MVLYNAENKWAQGRLRIYICVFYALTAHAGTARALSKEMPGAARDTAGHTGARLKRCVAVSAPMRTYKSRATRKCSNKTETSH